MEDYEQGLMDDIDECMNNVGLFFNILKAGEFDDPIGNEVGYVGKELTRAADKRIDVLCETIKKIIGNIEVKRRGFSYYGDGPGEIVGVKFTPSEILVNYLNGKKFEAGCYLEINNIDRAFAREEREAKAQETDPLRSDQNVNVALKKEVGNGKEEEIN